LPPDGRRTPTLLAMGGGGFTAGTADPVLDELVLRLTGTARPRVCLLPTAGGDSEHQIRRFYETYGDRLCEPSHISLFRLGRRPVPLREHLLSQDAIYVGGGSMVNLLAIWRAQGLDSILHEAWREGVVLAGLSAGSMCWFEWGVSTSYGHAAPAQGLGFLVGSNSVHHDSEPSRRPVYLEAVRRGEIPPGYAVDDGAALIFRDRALHEVVSARPAARAYEVDRTGERALDTRAISAPRPAESAQPAVAELRRLRLAKLAD
jgi:dipeptidase E